MSDQRHFADAVRDVERQAIERYTRRLREYGEDPRTLGWDTRAHQWARFDAVADALDLQGRSVLDIGCGLADFRLFLLERGIAPASYAGIDINEDLLAVARRRFPEAQFDRRNIIVEPYREPVCDVAIMLGLVNFRLHNLDNYEYAAKAIDAAFAVCREALVVDMLSDRTVPAYPREDFVFYFDPARMVALALDRTPWVQLNHAYRPLPQREFMLTLRKSPV